MRLDGSLYGLGAPESPVPTSLEEAHAISGSDHIDPTIWIVVLLALWAGLVHIGFNVKVGK